MMVAMYSSCVRWTSPRGSEDMAFLKTYYTECSKLGELSARDLSRVASRSEASRTQTHPSFLVLVPQSVAHYVTSRRKMGLMRTRTNFGNLHLVHVNVQNSNDP